MRISFNSSYEILKFHINATELWSGNLDFDIWARLPFRVKMAERIAQISKDSNIPNNLSKVGIEPLPLDYQSSSLNTMLFGADNKTGRFST